MWAYLSVAITVRASCIWDKVHVNGRKIAEWELVVLAT